MIKTKWKTVLLLDKSIFEILILTQFFGKHNTVQKSASPTFFRDAFWPKHESSKQIEIHPHNRTVYFIVLDKCIF